MSPLPYWRLSSFYFCYFAFVGAFAPYWSLYLGSLEFSAFQIGVLMSLLQVTRIFAPGLWGWLADRTGRRVAVVQLAALLSLLAFSGTFVVHSFAAMFILMFLMSTFWSASLPLLEAITLGHLGARTERYGRIRLWGSVGFIFAVLVLGFLLDHAPIRSLLWAVLGLKFGIFLFSRHIPEPAVAPHPADAQPVMEILRRPDVAAFMSACFLMAMAHGVYYTFYSLYLVGAGYSTVAVGGLWALGVVCEVLVFLAMPRLQRRFGMPMIFAASFALATVRFVLIGWGVGSLLLLLLAQVLHAASFGAYHAAAVEMTHRFFPGRHQAKGQALYTGISFGLGGTVGGIMSGFLWTPLGPAWSFTLSAGCALLALAVLARARHRSAAS